MLQFFSGNIGLHHVHHLSAKVPNYNLQRAHDENPIFHDVPTLSLWDGLRAVRLKLWDEERRRLVTFAEARRANPPEPRMADRDDARVHLLADRPHLPAQPGRAGGLQRRQVRRRLLAQPRAGAAAQARVRRPSRSGSDPGGALLDLGCGWGPLLDFVRSRGGTGVGVTLSSAQAAACRRHGLDVHLAGRAGGHAATPLAASTPSPASARSSTSARPRSTAPDARTRSTADLFARIASLLPDGGRLLPPDDGVRAQHDPARRIDIRAPRDSDAWYLALMGRQFPGSLPPVRRGADRPQRRRRTSASCRAPAAGSTTSRRSASGAQRFAAPSVSKTLLKLRLLPRWLTSADFRLAFTSGVSANSVCFERELLDHYRLVFEKEG